MVHGGGIGATAMVSRPISDLDIIHPAYLPASGGLTLHLMGQNLFTDLPSFNRGRCRIGSFDMVTRFASSSTAPGGCYRAVCNTGAPPNNYGT